MAHLTDDCESCKHFNFRLRLSESAIDDIRGVSLYFNFIEKFLHIHVSSTSSSSIW